MRHLPTFRPHPSHVCARAASDDAPLPLGTRVARWLTYPVARLRSAPPRHSMEQERTRHDQTLALKLSRVFERDLQYTSLQGVRFYVQGGVVTLHGTVAHALDRQLVVDAVRGVRGVEGVVAHLHVREGH